MVAVIDPPIQHMTLSNIKWDTFERIVDDIDERHYRVAYLDGDLEITTISLEHENNGEWIGRLIFFVALEFHAPLFSGGSTTLKSAIRKAGLEPRVLVPQHHVGLVA